MLGKPARRNAARVSAEFWDFWTYKPLFPFFITLFIARHSVLVGQLGAFGRGCLHSLAAMPVLGKQVEENPLLWVLSNDILIQFHAKPRPLREREVPVYYLGIPWCSGLHPILCEVVEVLLNFEIGRGGCKVECSGRRNRSSHVVRRNQHIVRLSPGSKLLRFEETAKVGDVGLNDISGLEFEELAILIARVDTLAGR